MKLLTATTLESTGEPLGPVSETKAKGYRLLFVAVALLFGLVDALLLIGRHAINPANTDWLKSDPGVYQSAWEFLRHERWTIPPGWLTKIDYPFGISAAYLDVIPIIAFPLKLFAGLLPSSFQFFGVYLALCLVLQCYFALKLLNLFTEAFPELLIGAMFFLNAPILLSRLYVHFSLSAQWLILAALYFYFRPTDCPRRYFMPFVFLAFVAGGFSPYISAMILFLAAAATFRAGLGSCPFGTTPRLTALSWIVGILICAIASIFIFGFLSLAANRTLQGDGYTMFSLDMLSSFERSGYLPGPGYEGYNYLGAGAFLLLAISVILQPVVLKRVWTTSWPLVLICIALTLLALSPRVTFGQRTLFSLPVPVFVWRELAVFRSSGRFFWPVTYLLLLAAIVGPLRVVRGRVLRVGILATALAIQTVDLAPVRTAVAGQFRARIEDPLRSPVWAKLGASYSHLVIVPAWQCSLIATPGGDEGWQWFARLAATSGMTLNSVHAARSLAPSNHYNCDTIPRQVRAGNLDADTAYVLADSLARLVVMSGHTNICQRVDGLNVCTAKGRAPSPSALGKTACKVCMFNETLI